MTSLVPPCRSEAGFTLVEVLIALSLLSLLMLVLTSAMRSLGQTEERIEQRVEVADNYRTAVNFLQDALGRVSARRFRSTAAGAPPEVPFFEAQSDSLSWIGVMPARFGLGGRHYMHLAVESSSVGPQLVLRYSPWTGAAAFADWGSASSQVMAASVRAVSLRYQEPSSGQWSPVWPPPGLPVNQLPVTSLPSAVEIQVDGMEPPWPPLVIAVVPTRASDRSAMGATFGGGGR